ncbi:MAG: hypothetical protein QM813_20975 [Verrucomicrobiota bacterium]
MRPSQTIICALGLVGVLNASASPFATEVVRASGTFGPVPYHDPNSVLRAPATSFRDFFGVTARVKLVEAAYYLASTNTGLLTTNLILTVGAGDEIIVRFDSPIQDDPAHPYGVDLLVFGNAFFTPNQFVNDNTDMGACVLNGPIFSEPLKVSVSPGFTGQLGEIANDPDTWPWYRYDNGPFADSAFPTQAYQWNRATTNWSSQLMDFTKPVNPALQSLFTAGGLTAADGIDLYAGAGGGTGFDLRESGFAWIQYVKVEGVDPDFSDGEVDAFAAVRSMHIGDTLSIAPENLARNTAVLFFQNPSAETETTVSLAFAAVSGLAQVFTAPLTNWSSFAALPGTVRTAVQLNFTPLLGTTPVTFTADLALSAGTNYFGNGSDLLVLQSSGTNWTARPFTYHSTNQQVRVAGLTNFSAFVVAQFTAPTLQLAANGADYNIRFTPVASLTHTLERSTNLMHWSALGSFIASNALPVVLTDDAAPTTKAFYRVRLDQP